MSNFPAGLDAFTNPAANTDLDSLAIPHAASHGALNDAVEAIQATLGTNPQGSAATVRARLDAIIPSQTGNAGKFLTTDGTTVSWGVPAGGGASLPTQTGNAGKFLTTDGTTASWATITMPTGLPSQSGHNGKYLTTDGTTASWATLTIPDPLPDQTGKAGKALLTDGTTPVWADVLPTEGVLDNAVMAFVDPPVRVTSVGLVYESRRIQSPNNTITVSLGNVLDGVYSALITKTFTITDATYSAVASVALSLDLMAENTGFHFGADDSGQIYVENDPDMFPKNSTMRVVVEGGTALAQLGFTAGQYADAGPGAWYAVDNGNLPAIVNLDARLHEVEVNGGAGGGGASATRKRKSGYVYFAGPAGAMGAGVPTIDTATAHLARGLAAGSIISEVGFELAATNTGVAHTIDWYVFDSDPNNEFPGTCVAYLGQQSLAAASAPGWKSYVAATPYTIPADGDYYIVMVLRSGTPVASSFRMIIANTTVANDPDTVGATSWSTIARVGFNYPSFPASPTVGVTGWSVESNASTMPRVAFRMG